MFKFIGDKYGYKPTDTLTGGDELGDGPKGK